ncbi:MAG: hypothetical protein NTU83_05260 [Candidatus Hydrogenedentes bacterium]|nr:hypothetical protein [Candidatus Hydrogenedentota bacterium]
MLLETRGHIRAVIHDGFKYIASPKWLTPDGCSEAATHQKPAIAQVRAGTFKNIDPFGPTVYEALYDLRADPGEKQDIMAKVPEKARQLKSILDGYVAKCAKLPHRSEPPAGPELSPEMKQQMDDLGYF